VKTHNHLPAVFILLLLLTPAAWAQSFSLGTTNLLEGPSAGSDSVVLSGTPNNSPWTAITNATWLHLSAANQSGTGSTNVIFTFEANPGATRTGSLTVAGITLTITQAGSTYVASPIDTTNVTRLLSLGFVSPKGVAVDGAGNVYFAETPDNAIKKWIATNNTVTTLVSSGLSYPIGVAVDGAGNVYIADNGNSALKMWTAANSNVTTLVSSGLNNPSGVAVDGAGNVYIADTGNKAIREWMAANNTVITLVSSGLNFPYGVAVDSVGNVYFTDLGNNVIRKWTVANSIVSTLASTGLSSPNGLAVDGAGNVYFCSGNTITEWKAADSTISTLVSSGLNQPRGVTVDGAGNIYIADSGNYMIKELPYAFIVPTAKMEPAFGGSDTLPVVLPATVNLTGPFAPASDSPWLTISGCNNGVVGFAVAENYTTNRTAHISLLGKNIAVTQPATTPLVLSDCRTFKNGILQFGFSNNLGLSFTVWSSTNMLLPFTNWTLLGTATNNGFGQYGFNDLTVTNSGQRFYRVSSP